jgi:hypothetical protein
MENLITKRLKKLQEKTPLEIAKALRDAGMACNCDLDKWQPEQDTGHSHVCRIHKLTKKIKHNTLDMGAVTKEEIAVLTDCEVTENGIMAKAITKGAGDVKVEELPVPNEPPEMGHCSCDMIPVKPDMFIVFYADYYELMRPVPVRCKTPGYPNEDEKGRKMYSNTHFRKEEDAWDCVAANILARWESEVEEVKRLEKKLQTSKEKVVQCSKDYWQFLENKRLDKQKKLEAQSDKTV